MTTRDLPLPHPLPGPLARRVAGPPIAERFYFTGLAVTCAAIALIGFSPSYYLSHWMAPPQEPALSPMKHVHGALFTVWLAVAVAQPALVATGNRRLHMTLGWAALALWPPMLALIWWLAIANLRAAPPGAPFARMLLALNAGATPSLAALIGLGLLWRRKPATHKRLMAMTWGPMIAPAVGRVLVAHGLPVPLVILCTPLVILSGVAFDLASRRRVHPVWTIGGPLLVGYTLSFQAFAHTILWRHFCDWLR